MSEWLHHSHTKCAKCLRNIIEVIRSRKSIKDIQYYGKKRNEQKLETIKTELKIKQNELHKKPKVNLDAPEVQ
jgi:hypothetical protein